ncbi:TPA: hypothetical protein R5X33_001942 [Enterobacter cloacae]|nr:hypothetical protein [Enterobacter cloacae]
MGNNVCQHHYLKFISSKCGSGKGLHIQKEINEGIVKGHQTYHLIVQNTKVLLEQFYKYLEHHKPEMIVSEDDFSTNLLQRINTALSSREHNIVMITDKMFYRIDANRLKGWKVWIDDCTKSFDLIIRGISDTDREGIINIYNKMFITGQEYLELSGEENDPVNKKYKLVQINDDVKLSADVDLLKEQYKTLKFYHQIAVLNDSLTGTANQLVIAGWYDLNRYIDAGIEITYLANEFENSLLYKRWSHLFKEIKLPLDYHCINANDLRIDVNYFFDTTKNDKGLSKEQLKKNCSNIEKVQQWIVDNVPVDSYYWTTNDKSTFRLPGARVPVVTRGLNQYQDYNTCIFMVACNAHPQAEEYLNDLFDLTREDALKEYETEQFYQFVYRSCVRNYESTERVTVYVYDDEVANSIPSGTVSKIDIGLSTLKKKNVLNVCDELKGLFKNWKNKWNHRADTMIRFHKWVKKTINKYPQFASENFHVLQSTLSVEPK